MPANSPAIKRDRSAPFSEVILPADGTQTLTNRVPVPAVGGAIFTGTQAVAPYKNCSSGAMVFAASAGNTTVAWKDSLGLARTTGALAIPAGTPVYFNFAMSEITVTGTGVVAVVYWHGGGNQG